jgi:hypothetical protein
MCAHRGSKNSCTQSHRSFANYGLPTIVGYLRANGRSVGTSDLTRHQFDCLERLLETDAEDGVGLDAFEREDEENRAVVAEAVAQVIAGRGGFAFFGFGAG